MDAPQAKDGMPILDGGFVIRLAISRFGATSATDQGSPET